MYSPRRVEAVQQKCQRVPGRWTNSENYDVVWMSRQVRCCKANNHFTVSPQCINKSEIPASTQLIVSLGLARHCKQKVDPAETSLIVRANGFWHGHRIRGVLAGKTLICSTETGVGAMDVHQAPRGWRQNIYRWARCQNRAQLSWFGQSRYTRRIVDSHIQQWCSTSGLGEALGLFSDGKDVEVMLVSIDSRGYETGVVRRKKRLVRRRKLKMSRFELTILTLADCI